MIDQPRLVRRAVEIDNRVEDVPAAAQGAAAVSDAVVQFAELNISVDNIARITAALGIEA